MASALPKVGCMLLESGGGNLPRPLPDIPVPLEALKSHHGVLKALVPHLLEELRALSMREKKWGVESEWQ